MAMKVRYRFGRTQTTGRASPENMRFLVILKLDRNLDLPAVAFSVQGSHFEPMSTSGRDK
jgi:hypothetical protein